MPLYELFCIAAHNPSSPVYLRQLVEGLAKQIHVNGGVVRDLKNMGVGVSLAQRVRRNQQYHTRGDYFTMLFDTSPKMLKQMNEQLNRDPLVVKWTLLKKGDKLSTLVPSNPFSIHFKDSPGPQL
ncbi:hypothetical protein DB88DRAFT_476484 [Papiliotrema laurentii]|uniref:Ribosomal protein S6 n=1 Tax=Papiliotrema laurentii TaxID=5418 RepID=A0AAD9FVV5_PAPLA|nr:hypothetical protein DB88DRAFT_476484 [Papiliotrema laurentii]